MLLSGDRLVVCGDSITDGGRARPVGEGLFKGLGDNWPMHLDAMLRTERPDRPVRMANMGVSGWTSEELRAGWDEILSLKPDVLVVMIGINDVWRQFDSPMRPEAAVTPERYAENLDNLATRVRPAREILLVTPFHVESNRGDAMRRRTDEYGAIVRETAARHERRFLDAQAVFDRLLAHVHSAAIAWDRVHVDHAGHHALARAVHLALS